MFDDPGVATLRSALREWVEAAREHHVHEGFRTEDFAFARRLGFTCGCGDRERAWTIDLSHLRQLPAGIRQDFETLRARDRAVREELWGKATARAESLLHDMLDEEARRQLAADGVFHVRAPDGRTFRIERGSAMNVVFVEEGIDVARYCVHIRDYVPTPDHMLAQKLLLETDPNEFYRMANHTWLTTDDRLRARAPQAGGRLFERVEGYIR